MKIILRNPYWIINITRFESTKLLAPSPVNSLTSTLHEWPVIRITDNVLPPSSLPDHFGLREHILFQNLLRVSRSSRAITCARLASRLKMEPYEITLVLSLLQCVNHEPRLPAITSGFSGPVIHSAEYKSPDTPHVLRNKRVLVIGGGNSGCDIAVETSFHSALTFHSTRRNYHVLPRVFMGRPSDLRGERLLKMHVPLGIRRLISRRVIARTIGLPEKHGLPQPDHSLWETHPVINDNLYHRIDQGMIQPTPDIERRRVIQPSSQMGVTSRSMSLAATGYRPPAKIQVAEPNTKNGIPKLSASLHPEANDFAVGMINQTAGSGVSQISNRRLSRMILANRIAPRAQASRKQENGPRSHSIQYVKSPRHALEVEHFSYSQRLKNSFLD